jgi:hypothetical protein
MGKKTRNKKKLIQKDQRRHWFNPGKDSYEECGLCGKSLSSLSHWRRKYDKKLMLCCGFYLCKYCAMEHECDNCRCKACMSKGPAVSTILCPICDAPPGCDNTLALAEAGHLDFIEEMFDSFMEDEYAEGVLYWYQKAEKTGNNSAQMKLLMADACRRGMGSIAQSNEDYVRHLQLASPESAYASYYLGTVYEQGLFGVEEDLEKALEYYRLSSDQVYPPGVLAYGRLRCVCFKIPVYRKLAVHESWINSKYGEDVNLSRYTLCTLLQNYSRQIDRVEELKILWELELWRKRAKKETSCHHDCQNCLDCRARFKGFRQVVLEGLDLDVCENPSCSNPTDPKSCLCPNCQIVSYCSRQCQNHHWKLSHKQECKELRQYKDRMEEAIQRGGGCGYCGVDNPSKRCDRGCAVWYCDARCQDAHWKKGDHKLQCKDSLNKNTNMKKLTR